MKIRLPTVWYSHWYFRTGRVLGAIVAAITFLGCWAYCIVHYGFLVGVSVGWFPSAIAAGVVGLFTSILWGLQIATLLLVALLSFAIQKRPIAGATLSDADVDAYLHRDPSAVASTATAPITQAQPPSPVAIKAIPVGFLGAWNENIHDCGTGNNDSAMSVEAKTIHYWESTSKVLQVRLVKPNTIQVEMSTTPMETGQSEIGHATYALSDHGKILTDLSQATPYVRARCPGQPRGPKSPVDAARLSPVD